MRLLRLRVMLLLASISMAGCTGHSTGCTLGTSQTDCAPGTAGYEQKIQKEQDTKAIASIDDARCLSSSGERGSPAYLECRRRVASDRQSLSH
jgi:outer membrane PBP1 activator LpoA protein